MSKEVVEWLREHARRCEQAGIDDQGYRQENKASKRLEAQYAVQFADEIERKDGEGDGRAGKDQRVWRGLQRREVAGFLDHRAP